jgi:hypothetical protein
VGCIAGFRLLFFFSFFLIFRIFANDATGILFAPARVGSCGFYFDGLYAGGNTLCHADLFSGIGTHTIALELNVDAHPTTLHAFVDGQLMPHYFTDVPASVHMAVWCDMVCLFVYGLVAVFLLQVIVRQKKAYALVTFI